MAIEGVPNKINWITGSCFDWWRFVTSSCHFHGLGSNRRLNILETVSLRFGPIIRIDQNKTARRKNRGITIESIPDWSPVSTRFKRNQIPRRARQVRPTGLMNLIRLSGKGVLPDGSDKFVLPQAPQLIAFGGFMWPVGHSFTFQVRAQKWHLWGSPVFHLLQLGQYFIVFSPLGMTRKEGQLLYGWISSRYLRIADCAAFPQLK